ncbi:uroporphyrinogen-III C-methyltransferase [Marinithermofilum abyssi]|uniref:uroporphyrinogen-III C-methyltransferase n=1 Tax=Marinithermofilum abyssi TaxID=1571185 RepID=A0A8J2VDP8_9BACL|nr:uroporphyrinogen-III C-methyltransferase [Marinithermofilum abyssi]GGE15353.1 uroporphyrinogen-III C-methyltransferase [Marinithermofilum abyssi]
MGGKGTVFLAGTGPGDPKLITIRTLEIIQQADVILYDRLVNRELLRHARADARLIDCGKRSGRHTRSQDEINRILVEEAEAGRMVLRLKGGDPGIFGRVGEEAACCAERGIPFEIVPGITSGTAAPIYAGIPPTYRGVSSSVAFVTGHQHTGADRAPDWAGLAGSVDTLVIYMGVGNLPHIQRTLLANGRPADTPVALIRWGTLDGKQETLTGTLGGYRRQGP